MKYDYKFCFQHTPIYSARSDICSFEINYGNMIYTIPLFLTELFNNIRNNQFLEILFNSL